MLIDGTLWNCTGLANVKSSGSSSELGTSIRASIFRLGDCDTRRDEGDIDAGISNWLPRGDTFIASTKLVRGDGLFGVC